MTGSVSIPLGATIISALQATNTSDAANTKAPKRSIQWPESATSEDLLLRGVSEKAFRLHAKGAEARLEFALHIQESHAALIAKGDRKLWRKFASDPGLCPVTYTEASRQLTIAKAAKLLGPHLHRLPGYGQSIYRIAAEALESPEKQLDVIKYLEEGKITPRSKGSELKSLLKPPAPNADAPIDPDTHKHTAAMLSNHYKVTLELDSSLDADDLEVAIRRLLKRPTVSALKSVVIEVLS